MTVTPVADPTVGNLATPVNSSYFSKAFLNALPAYRPALSPNRRGLEIGMAHGFFLYGPFTVCGPMRFNGLRHDSGALGHDWTGFDPDDLYVDLRQCGKWTQRPAP